MSCSTFSLHIATFQPTLWSRFLKYPWILIGIGLLLISPAMFFPVDLVWMHTAGYMFLYVGWGSILIGAMGLQARSGQMRYRPWSRGVHRLLAVLAWIPACSAMESIYGISTLAQQPIWYHIQPKLTMFTPATAWCIAMFLYLSAAIIAGVLMTYIVEFPILRCAENASSPPC